MPALGTHPTPSSQDTQVPPRSYAEVAVFFLLIINYVFPDGFSKVEKNKSSHLGPPVRREALCSRLLRRFPVQTFTEQEGEPHVRPNPL